MVSQRDIFTAAGPSHLTSVNWNCADHQRTVAASLVQGAYVVERDRQKNRQGSEARAPPWWEFFHFELVHKLYDDYSVFGAIYQFKPPVSAPSHSYAGAPRFVIAYRGTLIKKKSFAQDLKFDIHIINQSLHKTPRFEIAMQAARNLVSVAGSQDIWLAGHSLGSAMALLAGKNMAKAGVHLRAFLFNPPFVRAPTERIKDEKLKQGLRITGSFIRAGLAVAVKGRHRNKSEDYFDVLSSWVPNMFVNRADFICAEYIGYFEQPRRMEEFGVTSIGRLAAQNSVRDLIKTALGKESESEPLHLLPSAKLTVNLSPSPDCIEAHGIDQWWKPYLNLDSREYLYN